MAKLNIHLFFHPSTHLQFIHPCFTVHETIFRECINRSTTLRQCVICSTILRQCVIRSNILRQCVICSTILRQFTIRSTILRQCIIRSTTIPSQLSTVSAIGPIHRQCNRPTRWSNFAPTYPPPALPQSDPTYNEAAPQADGRYQVGCGCELYSAESFIGLKDPAPLTRQVTVSAHFVTDTDDTGNEFRAHFIPDVATGGGGGGWREQSGPVY